MTTAQLVYVGAKRHGGKLVHVYTQLKGKRLAERAHLFPNQLRQCDPGTILEVRCKGGDIRRIEGAPKVLGEWQVEGDVASWQATHRAVMASSVALATTLPEALRFALEPIRVAYSEADETSQPVLIAQVAQYVSGGT